MDGLESDELCYSCGQPLFQETKPAYEITPCHHRVHGDCLDEKGGILHNKCVCGRRIQSKTRIN